MPGANCCIVGCPTYASKDKYPALSFFKIPKGKKHEEWRSQLIRIVNRVDKSFNPGNAFICSRHFKESCYKTGNKGQRRLTPGSLPTEYLPQKSIETKKAPPRKQLVRDSPETTLDVYKYTELQDLKKDFKHVSFPWTVLIENNSSCIFGYLAENGDIIHKVSLNEALEFTIESSSLSLPENHELYVKHKRSISKVRIQWLLNEVEKLKFCGECTESALCIRSSDCQILFGGTIGEECCMYCKQAAAIELKRNAKSKSNTDKELHPNTPLCKVPKDKLVQEFKKSRKNERKLKKMLQDLEEEIQQKGACLSDGMHKDFSNIIGDIEDELPEDSFEKLFWQEQKKYFQKSPKAKDCLVKPGTRVHSVGVVPKCSFTRVPSHCDLKHQAEKLNDIKKYVVLMLDEVSIKDDLVYDQVTGELVGFVNLGKDVDDCHVIRNKEKRIKTANVATHALVFMVTSIAARLKFSLGYFATTTATADQLFLLMWKAVGLVETYAGLRVIIVVSDKAGPNQRLYSLHDSGDQVTYRTVNVFARDEQRYIYFFSDPPHLV
ncbi:uncharacterized protein LOC114544629 [Dendronephthya gigantea]|uniref:uncharacterized protein LOC114544629 n=1 Tax=Dendronephthya gigantea TaxID=151771 RepID=UPI0010694250|nr:uncharacterized protein LOC114544629 [Dendronephthya gigantea]